MTTTNTGTAERRERIKALIDTACEAAWRLRRKEKGEGRKEKVESVGVCEGSATL